MMPHMEKNNCLDLHLGRKNPLVRVEKLAPAQGSQDTSSTFDGLSSFVRMKMDRDPGECGDMSDGFGPRIERQDSPDLPSNMKRGTGAKRLIHLLPVDKSYSVLTQ